MNKNDRRMIVNKLVITLSLLLGLENTFSANAPNLGTIFPSTENQQQPSKLWLNNKKPYATNAWFINFVLDQNDNKPSEPVTIFPYMAQISTQGISLSYSNPVYYAEPDYPEIISAFYYQFENQIGLGTLEPMGNYGVASYHGLRVSLQWQNTQQQRMTALIVQGSPYVTTIFSNATPQISSRFKLMAVNQQQTPGVIGPSNRFEFVVALDSKNTQTWILYSEQPLSLKWESNAGKALLTANQPYTGWLRVVLQKDSRTQLENDIATLDNFSQTIPLDYRQTYHSKADSLTYSFAWLTQNNQAPLILSLPPQRTSSESIDTKSLVSYQGIKGLLKGETTLSWEIELPKVPILFLESKKYSDAQKHDLQTTLAKDVDDFLTQPFPDDGPYRVGKRLARAARLLLIANQLEASHLSAQLLTRLKKITTKKMLDKTGWHFEYDNTWGGIIPSVDDYGARHYNDHHFHYGYWVYSFAIIGKFDPDWLNRPLQSASFSPNEWLDKLIRDYANEDPHDPYFPAQRHQDDYAGHSWASGLTAFKDGQNQQSSSEAVNAYYALALYAQVINDKKLVQWAEFLMARELKAAQNYWQIQKTNAIYSEIFKANNDVVANLWDSKADANAFFKNCKTEYRCGLEYSFGIEMLPFTAISWQLLHKEWLRGAYPTIKKLINNEYGKIEPSWQWILIKGITPVLTTEEKSYFYSKALDSKPEEYDNGDSKTNTLYFLIDD